MNILIIEDEAPAYRRLIKLLQECDPSIRVSGWIQSVQAGLKWFKSNPLPDIVLSDIQLSDDLSFTIFKELKLTIPVIFITAYDEYALQAFRFYSIDYLLKPINAEDLRSSLNKYKTLKESPQTTNFEELITRLMHGKYRERLLVYTGDSLIPVSWQEVACFWAEDGATMLITLDNKKYPLPESLDTIEKEVNPSNFFRANRQFILSSASIDHIHHYGNQKLKLSIKPITLESIIVSKSKATAFKNWIGH